MSIVIAAHNEGNVLVSTLAALSDGAPGLDLDVVVVPNGCTDNTAEVARRAGVRVLDVRDPGKAAALNAGDKIARGFPRVYLDADIMVPPGGLSSLVAVFEEPHPPLAVVPTRRLDTSRSPLPVRAYVAINTRLPAFQRGLFGRGLIILSAEGRARFDELPLMVADDLFLDSLFEDSEKRCCADVAVVVQAPRRTRDLIRRLARVRKGNAAMRTAASRGTVQIAVRPADRAAWYRDVVRGHPRLIPAAIIYVCLTVVASALARVGSRQQGWGRDESTRVTETPPAHRSDVS